MKRWLVGLALSIGVSVVAAADEGGWYIGIGGGQSTFRDTCLFFESQNMASTCDDESSGWKVFAGRNISEYFGLELSYADAGETTIVAPSATPGTLTIASSLATVSAMLDLPLGSRFGIFGKAGMTYFKTDNERTGIFRTLSSGDDGLEPSVGAGFSFNVSKSVGIRAEWEHFNDATGEGSGNIDMVTASLLFHF